jgi:ubiquitin related modifier 1
MIPITVEFGGGLDSITNTKTKCVNIDVPVQTIGELIGWIRRNHVREKHDFFANGDGMIRPGVLVLVNETDWELEGKTAYQLQPGDRIAFISTLHGG